jgi:hypothetical protein
MYGSGCQISRRGQQAQNAWRARQGEWGERWPYGLRRKGITVQKLRKNSLLDYSSYHPQPSSTI